MKSALRKIEGGLDLQAKLRALKHQWLDLACGTNKQPGCLGMDMRDVKGVDIVHNMEDIPWPLPDDTFDLIIASHIVEHLKPWLMFDIFNEIWRVMQVGGRLMIVTPYAMAPSFHQDPTHIHGWVEATPTYFDPEHPSGLYEIYEPKPWKIDICTWHHDNNLEICLVKRPHNERKTAASRRAAARRIR